jgi:hypothetical protein
MSNIGLILSNLINITPDNSVALIFNGLSLVLAPTPMLSLTLTMHYFNQLVKTSLRSPFASNISHKSNVASCITFSFLVCSDTIKKD